MCEHTEYFALHVKEGANIYFLELLYTIFVIALDGYPYIKVMFLYSPNTRKQDHLYRHPCARIGFKTVLYCMYVLPEF